MIDSGDRDSSIDSLRAGQAVHSKDPDRISTKTTPLSGAVYKLGSGQKLDILIDMLYHFRYEKQEGQGATRS